MPQDTALIPTERIERAILVIRGQKVMLDSDLAALYEVQTRTLVQAVKRNLNRFPPDFMFQLTREEAESSRSQSVILNAAADGDEALRRGRNVKYLPYAFTEHGVTMLSSVLRSPRAVQVNIAIVRAFVRLRQVLAANEDLARRIEDLEERFTEYQEQLPAVVVEVFRQILAPPDTDPGTERRIGFRGELAGRPWSDHR